MAGKPGYKEVSPAVEWYVRQLAAEWVASGKTKTEFADAVGISKAHVSDLSKQGRGVGLRTAMGVASAIARVSWEEFQRVAEQKHREGKPEITLEKPERYPNRAIAVDFARKAGISDAAITRVESMALHSDGDLPVMEWLDTLREEDVRIRRGMLAPDRVAEERARNAAEVEQVIADSERVRAERLAALAAKRKKGGE